MTEAQNAVLAFSQARQLLSRLQVPECFAWLRVLTSEEGLSAEEVLQNERDEAKQADEPQFEVITAPYVESPPSDKITYYLMYTNHSVRRPDLNEGRRLVHVLLWNTDFTFLGKAYRTIRTAQRAIAPFTACQWHVDEVPDSRIFASCLPWCVGAEVMGMTGRHPSQAGSSPWLHWTAFLFALARLPGNAIRVNSPLAPSWTNTPPGGVAIAIHFVNACLFAVDYCIQNFKNTLTLSRDNRGPSRRRVNALADKGQASAHEPLLQNAAQACYEVFFPKSQRPRPQVPCDDTVATVEHSGHWQSAESVEDRHDQNDEQRGGSADHLHCEMTRPEPDNAPLSGKPVERKPSAAGQDQTHFLRQDVEYVGVLQERVRQYADGGDLAGVLTVLSEHLLYWGRSLKRHMFRFFENLEEGGLGARFYRSGASPYWFSFPPVGCEEAFDMLEFHKDIAYARAFKSRFDQWGDARRWFVDFLVSYDGPTDDPAYYEFQAEVDDRRSSMRKLTFSLADHVELLKNQIVSSSSQSAVNSTPVHQPVGATDESLVQTQGESPAGNTKVAKDTAGPVKIPMTANECYGELHFVDKGTMFLDILKDRPGDPGKRPRLARIPLTRQPYAILAEGIRIAQQYYRQTKRETEIGHGRPVSTLDCEPPPNHKFEVEFSRDDLAGVLHRQKKYDELGKDEKAVLRNAASALRRIAIFSDGQQLLAMADTTGRRILNVRLCAPRSTQA